MTLRSVTDNYGSEHALPGPYSSIDQVRAENAARGHHFFDRDTLRFFRSRIGTTVYAGRLFVTSEQPPDGGRLYTLRACADDGTVSTLGSECGYDTPEAARLAARLLAQGVSA